MTYPGCRPVSPSLAIREPCSGYRRKCKAIFCQETNSNPYSTTHLGSSHLIFPPYSCNSADVSMDGYRKPSSILDMEEAPLATVKQNTLSRNIVHSPRFHRNQGFVKVVLALVVRNVASFPRQPLTLEIFRVIDKGWLQAQAPIDLGEVLCTLRIQRTDRN